MLQNRTVSLWHALHAQGDLAAGKVVAAERTTRWRGLTAGTCLGGRAQQLRGQSVLIATSDQLTAIATLVELDGAARRIVLYPLDLPVEHLSYVARAAEVDAVVSDRLTPTLHHDMQVLVPCSWETRGKTFERTEERQTEWVLLTSGTTGLPKLVSHTRESLSGAIAEGSSSKNDIVWSTFYDIRRYGGLQIFLRAALTGSSLVLSSAVEPMADFLARANRHGVTHISGTPSQWRRALMSPAAHLLTPTYVRLSGEIADQAILDQLSAFYPKASISHAFASTEAGVAFEVKDGLTGFASSVLRQTPGVEMKVQDGSLRIRSARTASRYLNEASRPLKAEDGFVDTGDMLELRGDRYYFVGRRDGVINVGGLKVHPEEVEEVINRHPEVRMSLVRTRKNPITGALVVADVVLKAEQVAGQPGERTLQQDILSLCRKVLAAHKVPVSINFVPALAVADTGKLVRRMRNVIVTGGSRGIGLGIAGRLVEAGFRVIAIARNESGELTSAMQQAEATQSRVASLHPLRPGRD